MPDLRGNDIEVGDTVVAAMREDNTASLRVGVVIDRYWGVTPNLDTTLPGVELEDVEVLRVRWDYSSRGYLPKRPTRLSADKVYRLDRV